MDRRILRYKIWPRVFEAGKKSTVNIKGNFLVKDAKYYAIVRGLDDYEKNDFLHLKGFENKPIECKYENDIITFDYVFETEQEYTVKFYCEKDASDVHPLYKHFPVSWDWKTFEDKNGYTFSVYALDSDLWGTTPLRGDLHIHSICSDGDEEPEIVAANYRGAGFDFISLTDHHVYDSSVRMIDAYKGIDTNFIMLPGEEVHNQYLGYFHIVNVGGKHSVNDILLNEKERVFEEVEKIEKTIKDVPKNINKSEIAWRKWIYDAIKKSGGCVIFPHPYWNVMMTNHTPTKMCMEIFKRGLLDVFEVVGGCTNIENNKQIALYNEARAEGIKLPIVGSSDAHTTSYTAQIGFDTIWTIAFKKDDEEVIDSVMNFKSVAAIKGEKGDINIAGPLRMVSYAWFLTENYFPKHKELCYEAGRAMREYVSGDKSAKEEIEHAEKIIKKYTDEFFGRI